ncbi:MAG: hypothetical protein C0616_00820 [Desulfuromonas sp.]|nr:MAG: hypothetical protein C0616_00820 [Desulfuromonas sp.]
MRRDVRFLVIGSVLCLIGQGCTCRAWYEGFRAQQRQECFKIDNSMERQECLDGVQDLTYEKYQAAREGSDGKKR